MKYFHFFLLLFSSCDVCEACFCENIKFFIQDEIEFTSHQMCQVAMNDENYMKSNFWNYLDGKSDAYYDILYYID